MKTALFPLVSLVIAVGCGDLPTETELDQPDFAVAGNSGCYTVSGQITQSGVIPNISGVVSGDVEGDGAIMLGPAWMNGVVVFRPAEMTWEVTGGIVEPLIGQTVRFEMDLVGPIAHPPELKINYRTRVVEGAEKGNLTVHGTSDMSALPVIDAHYKYNGVICP